MTATVAPRPRFREFDANGKPLAGGLLYTYQAGTTTPQATYVDQAGVTQNTNPVVLDSTGSADVWFGFGLSYKLVLTDSVGNTIYTKDNFIDPTSSVLSQLASTATGQGDALIGVKQPFTGAIPRTQHDKNSEIAMVSDFGVIGDGTTDDTSAMNTALGWGGKIVVPSGKNVKVTGLLTMGVANTQLVIEPGASITSTVDMGQVGVNAWVLKVTAANCSLAGNGSINAYANWNGTNNSDYSAVVQVVSDGFICDGITFNNVPRYGVSFYGAQQGIVRNCKFHGNYPATNDATKSGYNGTQTGNFGVNLDPQTANPDQRNYLIEGNLFDTTIQGVFYGDTVAGGGSGTPGAGLVVTGNVFKGCFNHGVYLDGGMGHVVSGNSFHDCSDPITVTGYYHLIDGNTLYNSGTTSTISDTGISCRNPIGCIISNNTILGTNALNANVIALQNISGGVTVRGNIISNNYLNVQTANTNSSVSIEIGTAGVTQVCADNIVIGNVIFGSPMANRGVISIWTMAGYTGSNNRITKNHFNINNSSTNVAIVYGVYPYNQDKLEISGNTFDCSSMGTGTGLRYIGIPAGQSPGCSNMLIDRNRFIFTLNAASVVLYGTYYGMDLPGSTVTNNVFNFSGTTASTTYLDSVGTTMTVANNRLSPANPMNGSFTCSAATTTDVTNANVQSTSRIILTPTNAAAATLMGSTKCPWITKTAGTKFTINCGAAAAGTETFDYVIV